MKIVIIGPVYPFRGGIAHYTTLLTKTLQATGHRVKLYSFKRLYPGWLFPGKSDRDPSHLKIEVEAEYRLDTFNPLSWWATARAMRLEQPEILILQWWVTFLAPLWFVLAYLARRAETKVIFICHNVLPHEHHPWDSWLAKQTLRWGDGFIVQSLDEKQRLSGLLPGRPIEIVFPPPNTMLIEQIISQAEARQRLALLQNVPVLLFFGLVRPYKGLSYLLEAMPAVLNALPETYLLIAGEFWQDKQTYLTQMTRLRIEKQIKVIDYYVLNEDIPLYFGAADVVVLPYIQASQSGVLPLAYGLERPVIASRIGGLPEVVKEGQTGLLVPPRDAEALAAAIIRFFTEGLQERLTAQVRAENAQSDWGEMNKAIDQLRRLA